MSDPTREDGPQTTPVEPETQGPEAAPEAEAAGPAPDSEGARAPADKPPRRGAALALALAGSALLVSAALAGGGYLLWQRLEARLTAQDAKLAVLQAGLDELDVDSALRALREELRGEIGTLAEADRSLERRVETVEQAVADVQTLTTRSTRGWKVAEVEYLLRIAHQRLHLMRDLDGAVAALRAADTRLHELADPTLLPVREQLADAIQSLVDFQRPDLVGIALRLDRMISGLKPMRPAMPALETGAPVTTEGSQQAGEKSLTGFLHTVWKELSRHIQVRRHDQPVAGLPDAETELYRHQMLRLRLEAARVAVLRQDDAEFHRQLKAAQGFITEHYRGPEAQNLLAALQELDEQDLRPPLPDILGPYRSLRELTAGAPVEEASAP